MLKQEGAPVSREHSITVWCDRCKARPPVKDHFWMVRNGLLCDDCNSQWAVFRWLFVEILLEWSGQVVVDQKRRPTKFRF